MQELHRTGLHESLVGFRRIYDINHLSPPARGRGEVRNGECGVEELGGDGGWLGWPATCSVEAGKPAVCRDW